MAAQASKLARWLGADGAIFTWENARQRADGTMYTLQTCERMGIKSVLITFEHGGPGVMTLRCSSTFPKRLPWSARAAWTSLELPEVERVLGGGDTIRLNPQMGGERVAARGPFTSTGGSRCTPPLARRASTAIRREDV